MELQAINMTMEIVEANQVEEGELLKCSDCGKRVETTLQERKIYSKTFWCKVGLSCSYVRG